MFGFRRKKVVNKVTQVLRYTIGAIEFKLTTLPAAFWEDSYTLGFMHKLVHFYVTANGAAMGGLSGKQFQLAQVEVLEELSRSENYEVASQIAGLLKGNDSEFKRGIANAEKVIAVMLGLDDFNDDPVFIKAKEQFKTTPDIFKPKEIYEELPEQSAIAMIMQDMLLNDYCVKKWGLQV